MIIDTDDEKVLNDTKTFVLNYKTAVTGYRDRLKKTAFIGIKDREIDSLRLTTFLIKQMSELYYEYRKATKADELELNAVVLVWDSVKVLYDIFSNWEKEGDLEKTENAYNEFLRAYDSLAEYLPA